MKIKFKMDVNMTKTELVEIGKMSQLEVLKQLDFGVYLDAKNLGEVLLPRRYIPKETQIGDFLDVFIYTDSDDRVIATTQEPYVLADECACLNVVDVNHIGAFMDWGLQKDLFVPHSEQNGRMEVGKHYVVLAYLDDETSRIAASAKIDDILSETSVYFKPRQEVDLLIFDFTELGYKAIINDSHIGLIYKNEVFQPLKYGQRVKGFIKDIREDKKIDLILQLPAADTRDELMSRILVYLKDQGGSSTLTDKSLPEAIYREFSVSKTNYKKALGRLYKQKLIKIEKESVTLLSAESS